MQVVYDINKMRLMARINTFVFLQLCSNFGISDINKAKLFGKLLPHECYYCFVFYYLGMRLQRHAQR